MPTPQPPERGTMIISALLLLGLVFAGRWILSYTDTGHAPWHLLPWFGAAAVAIVVVGLIQALFGGGRSG